MFTLKVKQIVCYKCVTEVSDLCTRASEDLLQLRGWRGCGLRCSLY